MHAHVTHPYDGASVDRLVVAWLKQPFMPCLLSYEHTDLTFSIFLSPTLRAHEGVTANSIPATPSFVPTCPACFGP